MIEIFLNKPNKVNMTLQDSGATLFQGLPVLRVGCWNNRQYTEQDLQAIVDNFNEIKEVDGWAPPIYPRHSFDHDGNAVSIDSRDIIGWHKALKYNADTKCILADIEVPEETDAKKILSGKLKYVSSEIVRSGYSNSAGKVYDTPCYVGCAYVGNPAVKGMNTDIVINSQEYTEELDMQEKTLWQKFCDLLSKKEISDEELKAELNDEEVIPTVEQNQEIEDEKTEEIQEETNEEIVEESNEESVEEEVLNEDKNLEAQLEQLQKANEEKDKELERLQAEARIKASEATVDKWVSDGKLMPTLRVQAFALVDALSQNETEVEVLSNDAQKKVKLLDLLSELVNDGESKVKTVPKGSVFNGNYQAPEALSADEAKDAADRLVKSIGK